jgi:hypothetical protein
MVTAKSYGRILLAMTLLGPLATGTPQQTQHHDHHPDRERMHDVNKRGDHAMEFSHLKTTHHFRLTRDGGWIEVTAKQPDDVASQQQIRTHLQEIAKLFKAGDFRKPAFIHDEEPPGVPGMKRFKSDISYTFETMIRGARIRISGAHIEGVEAIHEFLRYQIKDHQTGDSLDIDRAENL